ncbi:unnamed protein product [Lactuca virosa]|uniref:Transposase, Ptta/En/Spm, plant n=1 Tax=Lactuca virosa TaxID=75947 RepID=A0AAU9MT25_9ASTR|nr:unnamed protein product [Lactuca virosa]
MWIFLVMMTIVNLGGTKRVRKEPRQISVTSSGEGSEGELDPKLCMLRRRKRAMASVDATGGSGPRKNPQSTSNLLVGEGTVSNTTEPVVCQNTDSFPKSGTTGGSGSRENTQPASLATDEVVPNQPQRRRRGPNINKKASQILEKQPDARITLTRDTYTKKFIGDSAISFATEVGIVMRSFCEMEFHTWEKVAKENKEEMINRLREKFELPHEDKVLMEYVDEQMRRQWKRTRNIFKDYWKKNGGMTDPQFARSKMKPDCRSEEDWGYLCDYWESDKAKQYAEQMKHNRGKLVIPSRGGSRSIANHKFAMTNKETQMPPSPIELYHKLHFDPIKKWINDESRIQYEEECAKLVSAGTSITQEMEYDIEKKVIKTICAKHKTLQSGWEASSGPVMRKKDIHLLSTAETSQSASKDEEDMKSKIVALEEEVRINEQKVKQSEEKCEKMFQFIISKFPDSQNILCPPDEDEARAYDDITDLSEQA